MGVGSALLEQTKDLQNNKGAGQVTCSPALFVCLFIAYLFWRFAYLFADLQI